jgi:ABC-2 type transport system ATP-binding protein
MRHLTRSTFRVTAPAGDEEVAALPGVHHLHREGDHLVFDADNDELTAVLAALSRVGATGLTVTPPSLEELFLRHYGPAPELQEVR